MQPETLWQEAERLIYTDDLTALYNRRFLYRLLSQIMDTTRGVPPIFSLLMIDLDHFKAYNDTFGHLEGDALLKHLAKVLLLTFAERGSVVRYAGDEFCIVLSGADKGSAIAAGEEIRGKIEQKKMLVETQKGVVRLTLSVGIATYPQDANSIVSLIDAADKALYYSKRKGGNIVSAAGQINESEIPDRSLFEGFPCPRFIGRQKEIARFAAAVESTTSSKNTFVLVKGDRGIGKTRFLTEIQRVFEREGFICLLDHCTQETMGTPYKLILNAVNTYFNLCPDKLKPVSQRIFEEELIELQRLIPALSNLGIERQPNLAAQEVRRIIFEGLIHIISEISQQQDLLILFDEVHHIDEGTLEIISHLLKAPKGRIVMAGAARSSEEDDLEDRPLHRFLGSIKTTESFRLIMLEAFTPAETSEFISAIFPGRKPDPSFDQTLHEISGGNPLFIEEALKALIMKGMIQRLPSYGWEFQRLKPGDLPPSLIETIRNRILSLDEEAKELISKASVIGGYLDLEILKNITMKNEGETLDLIDRARRLRILERTNPSQDDRLNFLSTSIQEATYTEVANEQFRRDTHQQIGEFLESKFRDAPSKIAHLLAYHFHRGIDPQRAQRYETLAREQAELTYNPEEVKRYLEPGKRRLRAKIAHMIKPLSEEIIPLASEFVRSLNLAIKNTRMYPSGSSLIKEAMNSLHSLTERFLEKIDVLSLKEEKGHLNVNNVPLQTDLGGIVAEIHNTLKEHYIIEARLAKGVTRNEIDNFVRGLSAPPETGLSDPDYWNNFLDENQITHIDIIQRTYVVEKEKKTGETTIVLRRIETPLDEESMLLMRDVLRYFCATIENIKLYPAESRLTTFAMDLLVKSLDEIFKRVESFTFSRVGDVFLINGIQANPQILGAPVNTLAQILKDHLIKSCTLVRGVTEGELSIFLGRLAGQPSPELGAPGYWDRFLRDKNISHIAVDLRIYGVAEEQRLSEGALPEVEGSEKKLGCPSSDALLKAKRLLKERPQALLDDEIIKDLKEVLTILVLDKHQKLAASLVERLLENMGEGLSKIRLKTIDAILSLIEGLPAFVASELIDNTTGRLIDALRVENNPQIYAKLLSLAERCMVRLREKGQLEGLAQLVWAINKQKTSTILGRESHSALERLIGGPIFASIADDLSSPDISRYLSAERIIEGFGDIATQLLMDVIKHEANLSVRQRVARLLKRVTHQHGKLLSEELSPFSDSESCSRITEVLDLIIDHPAEFLRPLFLHQSERVRRAALNTLKRLPEESTRILTGLLEEGSLEVNLFAITALGELRCKDSLKQIIDTLERSNNTMLKKECCIALGKIGNQEAIPTLLRLIKRRKILGLIKGEPDELRAAAAWALGNFKTKEAVEILKDLTSDKSPKVSSIARMALK